jgi:ADP-ribose pyrophosphatase
MAHLFHATGCRRVADATSPDIERPDVLLLREEDLLRQDTIDQFGGASHVALLALVTNPRVKR